MQRGNSEAVQISAGDFRTPQKFVDATLLTSLDSVY